jgi:hypothetical protein
MSGKTENDGADDCEADVETEKRVLVAAVRPSTQISNSVNAIHGGDLIHCKPCLQHALVWV